MLARHGSATGSRESAYRLFPIFTQEAALLSILANHTTSPRSWFVLWWGDYHGSAVISLRNPSSKVDHGPSSDYCVFTGPHRAWKDFWSYPRWWWARRPPVFATDTINRQKPR
jgi:hypothetical protein